MERSIVLKMIKMENCENASIIMCEEETPFICNEPIYSRTSVL